MPEKTYVIAMGADYGRIRTDSEIGESFLPVDVYLPGCLPKPEAIIDAITKLRNQVSRSMKIEWNRKIDNNITTGGSIFISSSMSNTQTNMWGSDAGNRNLTKKVRGPLLSYVYGYNYLRSQCAYDVAPGGLLAFVYHLTRIQVGVDQPEENPVCFLDFEKRRFAFKERESDDMLGISDENHPRMKRIFLPETWIGLPLRKDEIAPPFYEIQDAH
ncbi:NAD(P)H-quinone oxidoreductase subunit J [Nymphaea thermarum]|nr:NAD(P)H-quinone oxidoreductase subunit J [Nymphaea thermarum]